MKCPACDRELTKLTVGEVEVDICKGGCGGVWFDAFELEKFDEPHESAGEELLQLAAEKTVTPDLERKRKCPRCGDGVTMLRHFFSVKRQVRVDECPGCGGVWLDAGELATIRSQFPTEAERNKAADAYFEETFGEHLTAMHGESEEKAQKAHRFAHMFRYLCPSWYIPGKQDWGAF